MLIKNDILIISFVKSEKSHIILGQLNINKEITCERFMSLNFSTVLQFYTYV